MSGPSEEEDGNAETRDPRSRHRAAGDPGQGRVRRREAPSGPDGPAVREALPRHGADPEVRREGAEPPAPGPFGHVRLAQGPGGRAGGARLGYETRGLARALLPGTRPHAPQG